MTDEDAEIISNVATAFTIVVGQLIVELGRAGSLDRDEFTALLRRKVFDAEETGNHPKSSELLYIRLIADAVDNEPR